LPALNAGTFFAGTWIGFFVAGLIESLAARSLTSNAPKPTIDTFSPFTSASVIVSVTAASACSASFLE